MGRFVLLYQGAGDPSPQEERSIVSALRSGKGARRARVVDRMPGSLLVEAPESDVAGAVCGRNWTFCPERPLGAAPPHKRLKQVA
ncbi:hypothetical protein M5C99_21060 [Acidovorax sp. NCPPB 2350]|nr:hypothetical protein M5C99_21060 [Acidovorax sp. NCPPB 2350]